VNAKGGVGNAVGLGEMEYGWDTPQALEEKTPEEGWEILEQGWDTLEEGW
jgi:hypothetical protein